MFTFTFSPPMTQFGFLVVVSLCLFDVRYVTFSWELGVMSYERKIIWGCETCFWVLTRKKSALRVALVVYHLISMHE